MGYEIDRNGKYVGWSDIFDYSSIREFQASEYLPIPTGVKYIHLSYQNILNEKQEINNKLANDPENTTLLNRLNFLNSVAVVNISDELTNISNIIDLILNVLKELNIASLEKELSQESFRRLKYLKKRLHILKADKIKLTALLLRELSNLNVVDNIIYLDWNNNIIHANEIFADLNKHSATILSPLKIEKCLKNAVSSSIANIILNLRNMDMAYSPIIMDDFRKASEHSPKGSKSERMTLMNPLTKFIMQELNMVGKDVIGITAVGEKVFFNTSYYWNEGIRSGDEKWIKNLLFSRTFDRILGRANNQIKSITKTTLANVNFEGYENLRLRFAETSKLDERLRIQHKITDEDIKLKNDKWKEYRDELFKTVKDSQSSNTYADDIISLLLSAATDNAKELILAKINANSNLAKCYLHLIMMGFDINDIVAFMTSDAVSMINDLASANMFDEYLFNLRIEDCINILNGDFPLSNFFQGEYVKFDEDESEIKDKTDVAFNRIHFLLLAALLKAGIKKIKIKKKQVKTKNGEETKEETKETPITYKVKDFLKMIHDFYHCRLKGLITEPLISFASKKRKDSINMSLFALSSYIENIITKIKASNIEIENNPDADFIKDLNEFEKVYELANETSTLGSVFLGLNQGIPTTKVDLLNKVLKILKAVSTRESIMGIYAQLLTDAYNSLDKTSFKTYLTLIHNKILENNPLINSNEIDPILIKALNLGIVNNFDFFKWLNNENGYREATSNYYNLIKGTWNIFDIIEKLPHFNAIFENFKAVLIFDKELVKKSHILNIIVKELYGNYSSVDEQTLKNLITYVDKLLILRYINKSNIKFPIHDGDSFLKYNWKEFKYHGKPSFITLDSEANRGTFKKLFEEKLFPALRNGYYVDENGNEIVIPPNAFIYNLDLDINSDNLKFLKLDLDMQNISGTAENEGKYLECLTDFIKLKNYKLGDRSLSDWFILYNLLINKNLFGVDRLTSLFGPFINIVKEDSEIKNILLKAGDYDFSDLDSISDDDILKEIGYDRLDALYHAAPFVNSYQENNCKAAMIKQRENGMIVYKLRNYREKKYGPSHTIIFENNYRISDPNDFKIDKVTRYRNWMQYSVLSTPFANNKSSTMTNLRTNDVSLVYTALQKYIQLGIITVYTENC